MRRVLFVCLPILLIAGLAGCGQKGPLYLPVTPPRTIPTLPQAATHAAPGATHTVPAAATRPAPVASKPY